MEKVPSFLKSHRRSKKHDHNRFRVPIIFETNRFTFEEFPPPPPLLHPNTKETCQTKPTTRPYKKALPKRHTIESTTETCKRDLQKRPAKETYKRDLQKRPMNITRDTAAKSASMFSPTHSKKSCLQKKNPI